LHVLRLALLRSLGFKRACAANPDARAAMSA
jgi:hypothetical protein